MAQIGTIYAIETGAGSFCYLKYRTTESKNGTPRRVRKTVLLCKWDGDVYYWSNRKNRKGEDHDDWSFSPAVRRLQRETMDRINAEETARLDAASPKTQYKGQTTIAVCSGRWCSCLTAFVRRTRRSDLHDLSAVIVALDRFLWPVLQAATRQKPGRIAG